MRKITELLILIPLVLALLALIFAMHYELAQAGEPRALWLMQIIGVM